MVRFLAFKNNFRMGLEFDEKIYPILQKNVTPLNSIQAIMFSSSSRKKLRNFQKKSAALEKVISLMYNIFQGELITLSELRERSI